MSELKGKGGEDDVEVASVYPVTRAKEGRSELPLREARLGKRLGNGRFSGSGEAVEPEHSLI